MSSLYTYLLYLPIYLSIYLSIYIHLNILYYRILLIVYYIILCHVIDSNLNSFYLISSQLKLSQLNSIQPILSHFNSSHLDHPPIRVPIHLSITRFPPFIHPFIYPSIHPSIRRNFSPPLFLFYISPSLPTHLSWFQPRGPTYVVE